MKGSKPEHARRSQSQSAVSTTSSRFDEAGEGVVVHVEHARRLPEALQHHAEPDEVERRVVQHRAAEQAQAELHEPPDVPVEADAVLVVLGARAAALVDQR